MISLSPVQFAAQVNLQLYIPPKEYAQPRFAESIPWDGCSQLPVGQFVCLGRINEDESYFEGMVTGSLVLDGQGIVSAICSHCAAEVFLNTKGACPNCEELDWLNFPIPYLRYFLDCYLAI